MGAAFLRFTRRMTGRAASLPPIALGHALAVAVVLAVAWLAELVNRPLVVTGVVVPIA